eukprot:NODE_672_length_4853_cov_0.171855.p3 type:complete len:131 gc:universal NODE_672_length_4853_cov_0.171855:3078-3470(+)
MANKKQTPVKTKRKALRDLAIQSLSLKEISRKYNTTPKTIRDWRKNAQNVLNFKGRESRKMVPLGHNMKFASIEEITIERIRGLFMMECKIIIDYELIKKWMENQDLECVKSLAAQLPPPPRGSWVKHQI